MSENVNYKPGDIIILLSGGPDMTVEKVEKPHIYTGSSTITAIWFDNNNILNRDTFLSSTIKLLNWSNPRVAELLIE